MSISIYTDASSRSDLNKTSYGYLLVKDGEVIKKKVMSLKFTDCNSSRGELLAVIEAFKMARYIFGSVTVVTDSDYTYNVSTGYVKTKNSLTKNKKKPKKNLEDVIRLANLIEGTDDVKFVCVKGHSFTHWNNEIDKLVREEARKGGMD